MGIKLSVNLFRKTEVVRGALELIHQMRWWDKRCNNGAAGAFEAVLYTVTVVLVPDRKRNVGAAGVSSV